MNITRLSLLTIAAALALAGCGNKGPLVLPDAPDEAEAAVAAGETDEADANVEESADDTATDDTDPAVDPADDTDAPVEPEPLPQDDGDGG